jgi:hypothetical protein
VTILTLEAAPAAPVSHARGPCQVVEIYEGLESARHTQQHRGYLARKLQLPAQNQSSQWKLNLLENPKLRELVAEEVAAADVILVSTRGDRDLPEEAKESLSSCLARHSGRCGKVVLLFERFDNYYARTAIRQFLQQVTQANGLELLTESPDWGGEAE